MSNILQDFRYSLRLLRRTPGFAAVAVLVLALGIGANTAMFSLVNALLLKPMPGRVGDLVGVFNKDRTKPDTYRGFSYPAYTDLRDQNDVFESLMAHTLTLVGIREGDSTRRTFAAVVSSNYFTTLGVPLVAGRTFSADEERPGAAIPVAIASDGLWRRAGGDSKFLGSTLTVNATAVTIVGIAPPGFTGTMAIASPDLWFPLGVYDQVVIDIFKQQANGIDDRLSDALIVAGRLKPGLTIAAAEPHLDQIAIRLAQAYPATDRDRAFTLARLRRLGTSTNPQSRDPLAAVSGMLILMAALVLVVACLNLANLMLARSVARRKEMAIRLALGGGRGRIVQQLLTEGLVLSIIGGAAGVVIAWWTTSLLAASLSRVFPISVVIDAAPILTWSIRVAAGLFSAFGGLALLLATIGVYGLKAYDVSRRTREIGIRMALGATGGDVEWLVMREGLRTTGIGLGIGLLLAAGLGKLLSGLLYRVSPFDPAVMAIAAVALSAAATMASYIPARCATRVVPLEALRSE